MPESERLLGIDYGEKRIGLAYGDELGIALPLAAVVSPADESRWLALGQVIAERKICKLVVGYPINMDGSVGFKAREVDQFIGELERRFGLPVERVDERLTSRQAGQQLREAGGRRHRRHERSIQARQAFRQTGALDSQAAAVILQDFMNERFDLAVLPIEDLDDEAG